MAKPRKCLKKMEIINATRVRCGHGFSSRSSVRALLDGRHILKAAGSRHTSLGSQLRPRRTAVLAKGFEKLSLHPSFDPNSKGEEEKSEPPPREDNAGEDNKAGPVRVQATRGGKGGKTVTVITGLPSGQLQPLCKKLKALCGAGGKVRDATVEIQGDHTAKLVETLKGMGFKDTKKSGG